MSDLTPMTPLGFDNAVSMTLLNHVLVVSMTQLSHDQEVTLMIGEIATI
jgi:hypothetical protein